MHIKTLFYVAQVLRNQQDLVYRDYAYKVLIAIVLSALDIETKSEGSHLLLPDHS